MISVFSAELHGQQENLLNFLGQFLEDSIVFGYKFMSYGESIFIKVCFSNC